MRVRDVKYEDFVNYRKPSMFISTASCTFKCFSGLRENLCQNLPLLRCPVVEIDDSVLVGRYVSNPFTSAVVVGGLEPFDQFGELFSFARTLRKSCDDDLVVYTGYDEHEVSGMASILAQLGHVIVKYGRFVEGRQPRFDPVLGVVLSSDNQHAVEL